MYVDEQYIKHKNGKVYKRVLLRESYRENGKVKKRTIANLSHCSKEEIEAIRLALKYKGNLSSLFDIKNEASYQQGLSFGAVYIIYNIAKRLNIEKALGKKREGKLALWQIIARVIDQGSRLSAVRLAEAHAVHDIIGLDKFDENDLYKNLDWLSENQEKIEKKLFKYRYTKKIPDLFLYDVSSSYLEGRCNELSDWGYNRDGKKGKKHIVIELLTDDEGIPVAVRVFKGNTKDTSTMAEQIRTVSKEFGVKRVTFVGDKGMLRGPQIEKLKAEAFNYITSITKPEIRSLLKKDIIQLGLFDKEIVEVESEGERYILRKNPIRAEEMRKSRINRIEKLKNFVREQNEYLSQSERRSAKVALRKVKEKINRYKLKKIMKAELEGREIKVKIDEEALEEEEKLDGCYVIKTDLPKEVMSAKKVHDRYKDLSKIEEAFRTIKTGHLEVRPVYVQLEKRTRGHVFVVMLSYIIIKELKKLWSSINMPVKEGIKRLSQLCTMKLYVRGKAILHVVPKARKDVEELIKATKIKLPEYLPIRKSKVVTKLKIK